MELPGRGKRYKEDLLREKNDSIEDYLDQIKKNRNRYQPYLIYGHSMGAILGLSVTKSMVDIGDPPVSLIVSGNPGPGVKDSDEYKKRYLMDDCKFKDELRKFGGISEEVLENEELYSFFSPIIRADFEVLEKNESSEEQIKINIPIYAVMGNLEEKVKEIKNWKRFTTSKFEYEIFMGNHFFIRNNSEKLAKIIKNCSKKLTVH